MRVTLPTLSHLLKTGRRHVFLFLAYLTPLIVILLAIGLLWHRSLKAESMERLLRNERIKVKATVSTLEHHVDGALGDLFLIADDPRLREFLRTGDSDKRAEVANYLKVFSNRIGVYDQVRVLDHKGMEKIRVNYYGGLPQIIPEDQLQDKSNRYYFRETMKLESGKFYVSPFDLNIEHGMIEQPLKPVIRFSTPIVIDGKQKGMVILNYMGSDMLDKLNEFNAPKGPEMVLLNRDGYALFSGRPENDWAFMYEGRDDRAFRVTHPRLWEAIEKNRSGQIKVDGSIVTYMPVIPEYYIGAERYVSPRSWMLISYISKGEVEFSLVGLHNYLTKMASIPLLLSLMFAVLLTMKKIGQEKRDSIILRTQKEALHQKALAESATKAKSVFLANMSHEIRTPLNAVLGFSDLLTDMVEDPKQKEYLAAIQSAGKNLLMLINDILDLSKIEAGMMQITRKPTKLHSIIKEIEQIFTASANEKHISLNVHIDPSVPELVLLDEIRVRQILLNLVGNAIKFTDSGEVIIRAFAEVEAPESKTVALGLEVVDTGIGIPDEELAIIFESFRQQSSQSTREYGGTGLGLTITKKLVEMMGGEIRVTSQVGDGSTFTVLLDNVQIKEPETEEAVRKKTNWSDITFDKQLVLIVDDVQSNLELMRTFLARMNLAVETAENGAEAVHLARQLKPDLIFMDLRMPILDGYDATKQIRADREIAEIPIITLTASSEILEPEFFESMGFDGLITKPISPPEVIECLKKHLSWSPVKE